jgi:hypothetical protein
MSGHQPSEFQPRSEPWRAPPEPHLPREELAATLEARRELGPQYESAVVDRLAYEVDRVIEAKSAQRFRLLEHERKAAKESLALAIVSLGVGIPISAISAGIADLPGLIVAWGGIVGVNIAHAWTTRRRG